jgi:hypothetical protein
MRILRRCAPQDDGTKGRGIPPFREEAAQVWGIQLGEAMTMQALADQ